MKFPPKKEGHQGNKDHLDALEILKELLHHRVPPEAVDALNSVDTVTPVNTHNTERGTETLNETPDWGGGLRNTVTPTNPPTKGGGRLTAAAGKHPTAGTEKEVWTALIKLVL